MEIKDIYENMEYGPAPESADKANEWLDSHDRQLELFINGEWKQPSGGTYFDTVNPANKEVIAKIAHADKDDVDYAVESAKTAQKKWWDIGGHARARYMYAIARQIQKHSRLFAVLESMDNGKPIRESRDIDVPLTARHFYHHVGWAQTMEADLPDHEPLGVIGGIVPWNFPLLIFTWKVAPALATGNTIVIKPAKLTSLTALLFAEICQMAGLPPGVVNVTTGSGSKTGTYILEHSDVAKITFTGSTGVGRTIRRTISGSGKKVTLELGGKSPFLVFEDADLDSAIEGIVDAIWFNQGQVCCAGSRLLVQESIQEVFIKKLKERMETLRVGNPLDKAVDIGAIIDQGQWDTIDKYVKIGEQQGGKKWQPSWKCPTEGYFYLPTLFTDVSPADTIVIEEIFGPVLVTISFRTPKEAVELANNSVYGLAASVWTENLNLALDVAPQIKAGTIWINCTNMFDGAAGFGGYRESGFGREGGIEGLWDFVKPKWEKEFSKKPKKLPKSKAVVDTSNGNSQLMPAIDRTAKMYYGGKQARPDGQYSIAIKNPSGKVIGEVGDGNRKDIRNAVEAAAKNMKWCGMTGHNRAQVIYYIAENLVTRSDEFINRIMDMTGVNKKTAQKEVELSIERLYCYASQADKYDGRVHRVPQRNVTLAMPEPVGIMAIGCPDEYPLLGFISTVIPAIAMGNNVIVIPSEKYPLSATDMYQIFDTSDLPAGAVNIITGDHKELFEVLSNHEAVEAVWYFGNKNLSKMIEYNSSQNMKRTWVNYGLHRDWFNPKHGEGPEFLRKSTEIKNIWVPYGE